MAPAQILRRAVETYKPVHEDGLVLEAWAQGYLVGSMVIMAFITVANMRSGVLLHKLILIELILSMFHGTFIFTHAPIYGWYLSATAILLNISWSLHNVISWMKTKPFLSPNWSRFYIITLALAQPYWVVEIYANFTYFNNVNNIFVYTRPYEALFRDPWWIFSAVNLMYNITSRYAMPITTVVRISPRFGVLLIALAFSMAFIIVDICAVTGVFDTLLPDGLNPFWKLATVFKALTDSIILDDFKTALDRLMRHKLRREAISADTWRAGEHMDPHDRTSMNFVNKMEGATRAHARDIPHFGQAIWRTQSLGTACDEDPLGDESNDRARNRANTGIGLPFGRSVRGDQIYQTGFPSPISRAKSSLHGGSVHFATIKDEDDLASIELEIASHAGASANTGEGRDGRASCTTEPKPG